MSRKVPVEIEWLESHPGVADAAEKRLQKLAGAQQYVNSTLGKYMPAGAKQARLMAHINRAAFDQEVAIARKVSPAFKLLDTGLRKLGAEEHRQVSMMKNITRGLGKWGWKLGWLGFRMVIVGRMLMRYLMDPMQKAVGWLTKWDKSLTDVAISLGLLEARGMGTANLFDFLGDTLKELPEAGLDFQAAMGTLTSVLIGIAAKILPVFSKGMITLADSIVKTWKIIEPKFIPALEKMMTKILPRLITLVEKFGPPFATGFIKGMETSIPLILDVISALEPFAETIGSLVGFILPLAPLMMTLGYAMYFIAPAMMLAKGASWIVHTAFGALKWIVPRLVTKLFGCEMAFGGLSSSITTMGNSAWISLIGPVGFFTACIVALVVYQEEIKQAQRDTAAFLFGTEENARAASKAFTDFLFDAEQATHFLENVGWADEWNKALNSTDRAIAATGQWILDLGGALLNLCFKHATPEALEFVDALSAVQNKIRPTMASLGGLGGALEGVVPGGGAGGGTMYITVPLTIAIENLSGISDLEALRTAAQEGVSAGIAEALRRRRP